MKEKDSDSNNSFYELREKLEMWQKAKSYYEANGWTDLVNAAEMQISKILDEFYKNGIELSDDKKVVKFIKRKRDDDTS